MKAINITYWIVTVIFAGFMIFSAVPDITKDPEAMQYFEHLGYPEYLAPFLGFAKLLGSVAVLIPTFNRLKEWAYAGLFFDVLGAAYSTQCVGDPPVTLLVFGLIFVFLFASYFLHHKRLKAAKAGNSIHT